VAERRARGRRRPARAGLALALLGLAAAGCASVPDRVPPVLGGVPAGEAERLVRRWENQWRSFPGLRAVVDFGVIRKGMSQRSAGALILSPSQLRFEVITPMGLPALVATAGPEQVLVFNPVERWAWTARPTPAAMARWLGVPIEPETLIRLLVGHVPPPVDGTPVQVAEQSGPHLVYQRGAVRQRVWVTPDGLPARLALEDGQRLTATFTRGVNGQLQGLEIEVPGQSLEVRVRYISGDYTAPPAAAFELTVPDGIRVESLD
jgi:hypothetical protein